MYCAKCGAEIVGYRKCDGKIKNWREEDIYFVRYDDENGGQIYGFRLPLHVGCEKNHQASYVYYDLNRAEIKKILNRSIVEEEHDEQIRFVYFNAINCADVFDGKNLIIGNCNLLTCRYCGHVAGDVPKDIPNLFGYKFLLYIIVIMTLSLFIYNME